MRIQRLTRAAITRAAARLAILAAAALASSPAALASGGARAPELPAACADVRVPDGHRVASRVYASGVQVYRWGGAAWDFVGPVATLFADHNFRGQVGTHYGGPTWESNSGARVVARRVAGCSPDPSAIAWLRLEATSSEGPGVFGRVTFVQRVNTAGGLSPSEPGTAVGEERRVPYTTEYVFYRADN